MKYYKSQNEYNPTYLFTFARKNELAGDYPIIELSKEGALRNIGKTLAYAHKDKKRKINGGKVQLTEEGNSLILKVPLSLLNNPGYILACAKAGAGVLPFEDTAWHIIQFE